MNLAMDTSVIGGNFLRTKPDFVFTRLSNLKLDIILKLNRGSDFFRKGSNWDCHSVLGSLEVNEFIAGIIKYAEKIEQPSGTLITTSMGMTILLCVSRTSALCGVLFYYGPKVLI